MSNIYLIGMAGCGKSTIGYALAERLKMSLIDTDRSIEKTLKMPIPEIFEKDGEKIFRGIETTILEQCSKQENAVISTGGGIILDPKNIEIMEKGYIVFLDASLPEILSRLDGDNTRPLLQGDTESRLKKLFDERADIYEDVAHVAICVDEKEPPEIVDEILYYLYRCKHPKVYSGEKCH